MNMGGSATLLSHILSIPILTLLTMRQTTTVDGVVTCIAAYKVLPASLSVGFNMRIF